MCFRSCWWIQISHLWIPFMVCIIVFLWSISDNSPSSICGLDHSGTRSEGERQGEWGVEWRRGVSDGVRRGGWGVRDGERGEWGAEWGGEGGEWGVGSKTHRMLGHSHSVKMHWLFRETDEEEISGILWWNWIYRRRTGVHVGGDRQQSSCR